MFMWRLADHAVACDVAQPGCGQVQARLTVREGTDHAGSATDLLMIRSSGLLVGSVQNLSHI